MREAIDVELHVETAWLAWLSISVTRRSFVSVHVQLRFRELT